MQNSCAKSHRIIHTEPHASPLSSVSRSMAAAAAWLLLLSTLLPHNRGMAVGAAHQCLPAESDCRDDADCCSHRCVARIYNNTGHCLSTAPHIPMAAEAGDKDVMLAPLGSICSDGKECASQSVRRANISTQIFPCKTTAH